MNETDPTGTTFATNSGGLVDIAKSAIPEAPLEKRGRGRPPGSVSKPAGGVAPAVAPAIPAIVWTPANVGAVIRLPFSLVAWGVDVPTLALDTAEQDVIVPAAVDVFNQFAPMAAAKWASLITFSAALLTITAAKIKLYRDVSKQKNAEADHRAAIARTN